MRLNTKVNLRKPHCLHNAMSHMQDSCLLRLFRSEIIGPNLVRTATSFFRIDLLMVGGEMFAKKCLDISMCISTDIISSSSSIFAYIKAPFRNLARSSRAVLIWQSMVSFPPVYPLSDSGVLGSSPSDSRIVAI